MPDSTLYAFAPQPTTGEEGRVTYDNRAEDPQGPANGRLTFVDGLRGIAALVVTIGHTVLMVPPDRPILSFFHTDFEHRLVWPFLFGSQMVFLFIMLSGFGLYWSEENRIASGSPATSLRVFAARRAWRILPTYYFALALGLVVVHLGGRWLVDVSASYMMSGPVTPGGLLSHLVLAHNMSEDWTHQVNPPLWSIAFEVQLYLLFPLLVLIGTRWNPYLGASLLVVALELINHVSPVPVFGLFVYFCAGMVVAHVTRRHRLPRRAFLAMGLTGMLAGATRSAALTEGVRGQLLWTAAFCCLLVGLVGAREGRFNVPTWRSTVWIGHRSYSLYATHFPVLLVVWALVGRLGLGPTMAVVTMLAVGVPSAIMAAALCYRWVELPSLARVRATRQAAVQTAESLLAPTAEKI
jgi:peptidoglycan/LPS O-acetylase OafA/YrhL